MMAANTQTATQFDAQTARLIGNIAIEREIFSVSFAIPHLDLLLFGLAFYALLISTEYFPYTSLLIRSLSCFSLIPFNFGFFVNYTCLAHRAIASNTKRK